MFTKQQKNLLWVISLCALLLTISGCASLNQLKDAADIQNPEVSLKSSKVTALSFDSAELEFTLSVNNPNLIPIKLAGFDYTVNIGETQLVSGEQQKNLKINARGQSDVQVPLSIKFAQLKMLSDALDKKNELAYRIQTTAHLELPVLGIRKLPGSIQGTLPIPKMPKISVQNIDIQKISFTGAKLLLAIKVENPNTFGIDLRRFGYDLAVNDKHWAKGNVNELIHVTENGTTALNIPLELNFTQLGMALYKTLTQSTPLNYQLSGNMAIDTTLPLLKDISAPFNYSGSVKPR